MNSISWFLYIAQVSNSLGLLFAILGGIGIAACAGFGLFATIAASCEADKFTPMWPQARYVALAFALMVVGNLMPEKNTMYAIAAAQIGEQVAKNETVQGLAGDATKALQLWIKRQIEPQERANR